MKRRLLFAKWEHLSAIEEELILSVQLIMILPIRTELEHTRNGLQLKAEGR